ncbi:MAG: hypothetical protein IPK94_05025 [Saprospiraceae bacterium]|nr:hypothetical protein [Saprospiraceae bacterium]
MQRSHEMPPYSYLSLLSSVFSQNEPVQTQQSFIYNGITTTEKITIDEFVFNEGFGRRWKRLALFKSIAQNGREVTFKTEAMVTHDDQFLYVGFVCHDIDQALYTAPLKRIMSLMAAMPCLLWSIPPGNRILHTFFYYPKGVQADAI